MLFSLKFDRHFDILIITSENYMAFVTFFFLGIMMFTSSNSTNILATQKKPQKNMATTGNSCF